MNTWLTLLIALLLLTVMTGFAQTTAQDYYKLGIEREGIRDSDAALLYFNKAIELDPNYTDAYAARGENLGKRRNYNGAIADYTKVIELGRKELLGFQLRALMHLYNGEADAAIADYAKSIELGGNKRAAYFFTAEAYEHKAGELIKKGEIDTGKKERSQAIVAYTRSIAASVPSDPTYSLAYSYRSICHSRNHDYELALADINFAIKVRPDFAQYLRLRRDIYLATGKKDLAAADEQRILELTGKRAN